MKMIRTLVDAKVEEAGGRKRKGYQLAANYLGTLLEDKKISTKDFSLRGLYEALCDTPLNEDPVLVAEDLNSSAFPTIVSKILHKDIIDEYNLALGNVDMLTRKGKATRSDEELVVGFEASSNDVLLRRQGMAYEESDFGEKNWKIFMADFGRMISLTREVIYEDRTGEVLDRAKNIGRLAGHHKQKTIIETLTGTARSYFEESTFQGCFYNGAAKTGANLYANDHASNFDGQANDNLAATNALVDYTDVDAVWHLFAAMVDEAGSKINIVPTQIIIPPALKATAAKVFRGDMALLAVGDGDLQNIPTYNPINDLGGPLEIVSSVFMPDTSTWYMGSCPDQLLELEVFPPETRTQGADSDLAFTSQIIARFRFSMHWGIGHTDYRYIVKSTA